MEQYAGLDVSLEQTSVCVVDGNGKIVIEAKVASDPEALMAWFAGHQVTRIGLEAGPLSQWLHAGLSAAGHDVVLLETRHVKAALSAMTVKTDRKDARGIAQLLRMGWYRPVHCKTVAAQELKALLTARKLLVCKMRDVELAVRGLLRNFGLKVGSVSKGKFIGRVRDLIGGQALLESVIEPLLLVREALRKEQNGLHKQLLTLVRADDVCRRLMTVPGVGAVTAMTFKAAIDDPKRFSSSKAVGAHFGLTPRRYQSGETDRTGGITKAGDALAREALYEAATSLLSKVQRMSAVKAWGMRVAKRRGFKRAGVAVARKLATIMHRMWIDETDFRWSREEWAVA